MNADCRLVQESTGSARDDSITGPHAGYDKYGRFDHYYWRCERCGLEATTTRLQRGCWQCAHEVDDAPRR